MARLGVAWLGSSTDIVVAGQGSARRGTARRGMVVVQRANETNKNERYRKMNNEAKPYPLNMADVQKGTVIPVHIIQEITGETPGTDAYKLRQLALKGYLERQLQEEGRPATIRCVGCELEVLNDSAAAIYNAKQYQNKKAGMVRAHWRNTQVELHELEAKEAKDHLRRLQVQSFELAAMRKSRRKVQLEHQRQDQPALPNLEQTETETSTAKSRANAFREAFNKAKHVTT